MPNPVVHWEIMAKDAAAQREFMRQLFDWQLHVHDEMNYTVVDTGGLGINGGIGQSDEMSGVAFYVEVDDLEAYLDKAAKLGAVTVVPPTVVPGMVTFAMFNDPQGHLIGLVKSEPMEAGS